MIEPVIRLDQVSRVYETGRLQVPALVDVDLDVMPGEFIAIVGPSGSGKSTMMNIVGCLDRPSSGRYVLSGTPVSELSDDGLARVRSRSIGFVFQSYNLLPRTSALENVAAPLMYQGVSRKERLARAKAMLERLGLGERLDHEPNELSGGQQQRVGIARALITEPAILLADEPTGNLDSHSGAEVLGILHELHDAGRTIVLITHDPDVAMTADRQVHLRDGHVVDASEVHHDPIHAEVPADVRWSRPVVEAVSPVVELAPPIAEPAPPVLEQPPAAAELPSAAAEWPAPPAERIQ